MCVPHADEPVRYRVSWHAQRVVNFRSPRPLATDDDGRPRRSAVIIIFEPQRRVTQLDLDFKSNSYRGAAHVPLQQSRVHASILY